MTDTRPMTPILQAAIDNAYADRSTIRALVEAGRSDSHLAALYAALAVELQTAALREAAVLYGHERDELARIDAIDLEVNGPPAPVEGRPATFDPDTREFKFE